MNLRIYLFIILVLLFNAVVHGQNRGLQSRTEALSGNGKRIALVIGNARYEHAGELKNPINDADLMGETLKKVGFEVSLVKNATKKDLISGLDQFSNKALNGGYNVALYYYSGHGVEVGNKNYLMPVDANPKSPADVEFECFEANRIIKKMEEAGVMTKIIILDACRNNPIARSWTKDAGTGGLGAMSAPRGTFIGFSTSPNSVALDGKGKNSPYTMALAEFIPQAGLEIGQVFNRVSGSTQSVAEKEGMNQIPFTSSSLDKDFYFSVSGAAPEIKDPGYSYLDKFIGYMIYVKGGTFTMGCTNNSSDCNEDEKPSVKISLSDYYIGETEVTQRQWREVMGIDPPQLNKKGCDQCPVERVSWQDVQQFISQLNKKVGEEKYRLPTEAEWEFAAKGGTKSKNTFYSGSNEIDSVAWYYTNAMKEVSEVKKKQPNELGIYDMSGNVWEWCSDWHRNYSDSITTPFSDASNVKAKVYRGGSWYDSPKLCRVINRESGAPALRSSALGFRLAANR